MSAESELQTQSARVIVVGNEKGGSGKSTVAAHLAIALLMSPYRVASIDLDPRQGSFTRFIENRRAWAKHINRDLDVPNHHWFDNILDHPTAEDEAEEGVIFVDAVSDLKRANDFVVIDTPGHDTALGRLAHSMADTLVTPLNDSLVDLDVIGHLDPATLALENAGHYASVVNEARHRRKQQDGKDIDWVVLRNRLSMIGSRNKRTMEEVLQRLSQALNFRCMGGLAERVMYREFFLRGLTVFDDLDLATLGSRPTLSHLTARMELENLMAVLELCGREVGVIPISELGAA